MSAKYKSPRKAIPIRIQKEVLAKSRRRCTLCFGLHGDETEKRGQIAHLDGNRSNNAESNLAWMCLDHHSLIDSTTKQHKNYTIAEVKEYRRQLYKVLRSAPERSSRRVRRSSASKPKQAERSAKVTNSPVASGANISQTINSPTLNLSWPAPTGVPGPERNDERYGEWRELIDEIRESIWAENRHGPEVVMAWDHVPNGRDIVKFTNVGDKPAFNVETGDFSWPELVWVFPLQVQALLPGQETLAEPHLREETDSGTNDVGSLMNVLFSGRYPDPLTVKLRFSDISRKQYVRTFILRRAPLGVSVELGELRTKRPHSRRADI